MNKIIIQEELKEIIEDIEVSDANYEKAENRYKSISKYIKESEMSKYKPDIYLQGSFKIGTAIKPLTEDGSYDIDIVCNFTKLQCQKITQSTLKQDFGEIIKSYAKSRNMINPVEESKRCWTINYVDEDNFHVDILPSVPMYCEENKVIAITDKRSDEYNEISNNWEISNPKGYANWFIEKSELGMPKQLNKESSYLTIEKIPCYKVKTPLQRVVQIFKRHAEVMFEKEMEYKPSSVIITTLVAKRYTTVYKKHNNLLSLMRDIALGINEGIERKDNWKPCIYNPVNKGEILSGKWDKDSKYYISFQLWVEKLQRDFCCFKSDYTDQDFIFHIKNSLYKPKKQNIPIVNIENILHHQVMKWEFINIIEVNIIAKYFQKGFREKIIESGTKLNKKCRLTFEAKSKDIKKFNLHWQITNTGREAEDANCLRGGFYRTDEIINGKKIKKELTAYNGQHYVEVYLVKNEICYGKSEPFIVNISDKLNLDLYKK